MITAILHRPAFYNGAFYPVWPTTRTAPVTTPTRSGMEIYTARVALVSHRPARRSWPKLRTANGVIDPGETVTVNFSLRNFNLAPTRTSSATLLRVEAFTSPGASQNFGALTPAARRLRGPLTFGRGRFVRRHAPRPHFSFRTAGQPVQRDFYFPTANW